MRRLTSIVVVLAVVVAGAVTGCTKVDKATSDSTPPTLNWHVENLTAGTAVDIATTGEADGVLGDDFRVTLTAADPQGIHQIHYDGGYTRSCINGNLGQNAEGDYAPQSQDLEPDAQNKVLTSIFLIEDITPDTDCSGSGYTWKKTTIGLQGTGTNYFNGVTVGNLTIKITP
jgi:FlaG/FlaF family flagellin (archaellin)